MTWRIPTDNDYKDLEMHLGMSQADADSLHDRGTDEGAALAGNGTTWNTGTLTSDARFGESGFDLFGGGYRTISGSFSWITNGAFLFTITQDSSDLYYRYVYDNYTNIGRNTRDKATGHSVRLVRDTTTGESGDANGTVYTNNYTGNDGTNYNGIKLDDKVWLAENLKETKYNDDTNIPRITDATNWSNDTNGARCEYNNNTSSESDTYGYLYNGYALENEKGLVNLTASTITGISTIQGVSTITF